MPPKGKVIASKAGLQKLREAREEQEKLAARNAERQRREDEEFRKKEAELKAKLEKEAKEKEEEKASFFTCILYAIMLIITFPFSFVGCATLETEGEAPENQERAG
jgi:hypothetical protein